MIRKPSGALVEQLLHKMIIGLIRDEVKAALPHLITVSAQPHNALVEPIVQGLAGGLFGLLRLWAEGKLRLSVDEVNALFRKLALPALKSVAR